MIWKIRDRALTLDRPFIMGIINVTPDSFYDGGKYFNREQALEQAARLIQEGADILDIGAESTRPGAKPVLPEEEIDRLLPVVEALKAQFQIPISVDTTKSSVAKRALEAGAHIINDVSGLRNDPQIAQLVQQYKAGLVLMHRRGDAETMQSLVVYEDLIEDVCRELSVSIETAESFGVSGKQIVIDPGIGFSKTHAQNLEILERLADFKRFQRPILIGPSRKSFIYSVTKTPPDKRLFGTTAACVLACERGAHIFRVHDVWAIKEALDVTKAIINSKPSLRGSVSK